MDACCMNITGNSSDAFNLLLFLQKNAHSVDAPLPLVRGLGVFRRCQDATAPLAPVLWIVLEGGAYPSPLSPAVSLSPVILPKRIPPPYLCEAVSVLIASAPLHYQGAVFLEEVPHFSPGLLGTVWMSWWGLQEKYRGFVTAITHRLRPADPRTTLRHVIPALVLWVF